MSLSKRTILGIAAAAVLAMALGAGFWVYQGLKGLKQPMPVAETQLFEVPAGSSFSAVATNMQKRGWIKHPLWLKLHARLNPEDSLVKAGTYEVSPGMTPLALVDAMIAGRVKTWSIQFIEGWTFRDMRAELARNERLEQVTSNWSDQEIMTALGYPDQYPEGRFFPDTYHYTNRQADLEILRRAYKRMKQVLSEEWEGRAKSLPYDSPYEALIMASIVEKETGLPSERAQIAGVFVRRLEKGMRLQTDPTVIYGMGERYQGNIRRQDLKEKTPYNTYRISGLPPTPIAMPGQGAIHAALHPDDGKALYFVARGDGSHIFSETFQEHRQAVRRFQIRNRRQDYQSAPPAESGESQ
ncbi:endolytic transglycosylase MltG [Marinobacteraceae bacterium S3BR75-40.1]